MIKDDEGKEWLPITLNGVLLGKISIDPDTGRFDGDFDKEYIDLIVDGLDATMMELIVALKPGFPISQVELNKQLTIYLEGKKMTYATPPNPSESTNHIENTDKFDTSLELRKFAMSSAIDATRNLSSPYSTYGKLIVNVASDIENYLLNGKSAVTNEKTKECTND